MNGAEELSDDLHPEELSESDDEDPGDEEGPATASTARPFAVQIRTARQGHRKLLQGFGKQLQNHVVAFSPKLSVSFSQATADLIPPSVTQKLTMFVKTPDIGTSAKNIMDYILAERDVFVWPRDTVLAALAL